MLRSLHPKSGEAAGTLTPSFRHARYAQPSGRCHSWKVWSRACSAPTRQPSSSFH